MENVTLEKYLRPSQLVKERHVPFSLPTLWRRIKDGSFPAPSHINGITCWPSSVIRAWQQQVSASAPEATA